MIEPNTQAAEPSIAELRILTGDSPEPEPAQAATEPTTETPDSNTDAAAAPGPVAEENTEAATGTAITEEPAPADESEAEIPEGVKKRIAKEVKEQARLDRLVTEAVSARKAKEAELAKLTADKPGSEPAPTTAPAAIDGKPVRPDLDSFDGTYAEYQTAVKKYEGDFETWLTAKTERTVTETLTARQKDEALKRDWEEATEKHGADFPDLMRNALASVPEGLQMAMSNLDNWSDVAVHLAKSPDELRALTAAFEQNPYKAVAELGKLEDRLQQASKPPETPAPASPAKVTKPLPAPPAKPGGAATVTPKVDLEKADMRTFKREMRSILG